MNAIDPSTTSKTATKSRVPRYRLYIDESGDHTYKKLDDFGHRYLALLGVWFRQQEDYLSFVHELEQFKDALFGERPDNPVILHRTDIINRRGAFGVLCDEDKRKSFDEGLLQLINGARFKMICVVLDKQAHQQQYSDPFHPYHYCLAAMLERYAGWLVYKNVTGDVMAESRAGEEDLQLKQAYRRTYESGTLHFGHEKFQSALTSKDIKIQPKKANIAGTAISRCFGVSCETSSSDRKGIDS